MRRALATLASDRTVRLVLLSRLITVASAPATLYLVAATRPAAEQGFYFVFANVQAIAALFEFGVGTMVVQFVGHATTGLTWRDSQLVGDLDRLERLRSVLRDAERWFGTVSIGLALVLVPGGILFFRQEAARTATAYLGSWLVVVASLSLYLLLVPALCALEGSGELRLVQRMRVLQAVTTVACLWIGIITLGGLLAIAVAGIAQLLVAWFWLRLAVPGFYTQWKTAAFGTSVPRSIDVSLVGAQSRTGIAWILGFLGPQLLAPLVFAFQGASAAGRIGLSMAAAGAPLTLALSWMQGRYPTYGKLAADKDFERLDAIARHATLQALLVYVAGEALLLVLARALQLYLPRVGNRLLPLTGIAALGIAGLGSLLYQAMAAYLRAHREESLLWPLVVGTAAVIGACAAAARVDATLTALAYAGAISLVLLPLAGGVFVRRRRDFHALPPPPSVDRTAQYP